MSDNWTPPPGRNPHEPDSEGEQPTDRPAPESPPEDGQSPLWWTASTEKPQEYLQPGPPGDPTQVPPQQVPPHQAPPPSGRPPAPRRPGSLSWNLPPYGQPGTSDSAGQGRQGPRHAGPASGRGWPTGR